MALNQTVKDSRFRSRYQAVILSISRNGKRIPGKLGAISLQVGDTLLLETAQDFVDQYRYPAKTSCWLVDSPTPPRRISARPP